MNSTRVSRVAVFAVLIGISGCQSMSIVPRSEPTVHAASSANSEMAARSTQTNGLLSVPATGVSTTNPPVPPAVQQVAWQQSVPRRNALGCGCAGCGPGSSGATSCASPNACMPAPTDGYATYSPVGWNAHGIDPNEFICNGGDHPPAARVRQNETLAGLEPEDAVIHYTTDAGDIHVQATNRTCVYSPRFASVRKITGAVSGGHAIGLAGVDRPIGVNRIHDDLPRLVINDATELGHADVARRIDSMRDRNRGVRVENVLQPEIAQDILEALAGISVLEMNALQDSQLALLREAANAAVTWTTDESIEIEIQDIKPPTLTRDQRVEEFTVYDFPDAGRLQVCKLADRDHAQPGEIVTFAIRVENVGDSAVNDITMTDNLTTRLEYVEDSQTCSGGAIFSTKNNEAESLQLVWMFTDSLRVGESVTIRFQCKVR